jgi:uncharacterized membrane protein
MNTEDSVGAISLTDINVVPTFCLTALASSTLLFVLIERLSDLVCRHFIQILQPLPLIVFLPLLVSVIPSSSLISLLSYMVRYSVFYDISEETYFYHLHSSRLFFR